MAMTRKMAAEIAQSALLYLADDMQQMTALMQASGLSVDDLRGLAGNPQTAVHLLDFVMESDDRVLDFARFAQIPPETVVAAHLVLSGPGSHGWQAD